MTACDVTLLTLGRADGEYTEYELFGVWCELSRSRELEGGVMYVFDSAVRVTCGGASVPMPSICPGDLIIPSAFDGETPLHVKRVEHFDGEEYSHLKLTLEL